ncbi:MAG TPA: ATP-binding protein [Acidimicrobiales bacterium]|jgi:two-component sensor histidine kinase|nr:ATP-binding protein [Acidimicrobiales bacterium]
MRVQLASRMDSAAEARSFVRDVAEGQLSAVETDALMLIADELVTNAVRHGDAPIEVTIVVDESTLRIEVRDGSPTMPRPMAPCAHGGFGLRLVEGVATAWGTIDAPPGKIVWAEL